MWRLWRWQLEKQFLHRSTQYLAIRRRLKYSHLYDLISSEKPKSEYLVGFILCWLKKNETEITSNSVLIFCVLVIRCIKNVNKYHLSLSYMSTSGNPNEGDLPHWIPPIREILRKRNSRHFQDSLISLKKWLYYSITDTLLLLCNGCSDFSETLLQVCTHILL